ncbi:MAG TPA: SEC-C metal-binding domain-containing protein, partial [Bdellovibrionota bacterium]|nr:SEC-C metal-binding domain-containing protein [Bdellovibrionota bacterium]
KKKLDEALAKWKTTCEKEREEVKQAGGLFILGTERHESRRIDNQLRGRAGRQGDPGASRFYLSLDDDLMRIFGTVNIGRFMEEDMPIEHRWITKAIENAQKKVEGHNYDIRKHLLEYDDVMNQQRKVVYAWRREVLGRGDLREMVFSMVNELAEAIAFDFFPNGTLRKSDGRPQLDEEELSDALRTTFQIPLEIREKDITPFNDRGLKDLIVKLADSAYQAKEKMLGMEMVRQIEKMILLTTIDHLWKDHLLAMDHLREGIGLQGYGQKDPLIEYKKQGFRFFSMMMNQITGDVVRKLFAVQIAPADELSEMEQHEPSDIQYNLSEDGSLVPAPGAAPVPPGNGGSRAPEPQRMPQPQPQPRNFDHLMRGPRNMTMGRGPLGGGGGGDAISIGGGGGGGGPRPAAAQPMPALGAGFDKVGRNDPCPCGSGKKFKKCHGA